MLRFIKRKIHLALNINKYKYESIKIFLIYLAIGSFWIYFSDNLAYKLAVNDRMLVTINIYKGWVFVLITATILYVLVRNILKKFEYMEDKLNESYEELTASNEELQAYVEQLTASEEELRIQYDQITISEEKLRKSEQKNIAIIKAIPDLLFIIDKNGKFIDSMTSDESRLYVPMEQFIGKTISEIMPKNIVEIASEKIQLVLKQGTLENFEYMLEGQYFELRMVKNNDNEVLAISRNITVERTNELDLKISENRYKTLVDEMLQGVALYEGSSEDEEVTNYKLVSANRSYQKLTGVNLEQAIGKSTFELLPELGNEYYEKLSNVVKTGKSIYYENYSPVTGLSREVTAYQPQKLQLAIIVNDITERKQLQEKLEYLSYNDQLTGLYNRRFFEEELIRIDNERNLPLTVIMADVNGLKLVNDSFGHAIGDELIKMAAKVIKDACREDDIVARLAGDEFVVFLKRTNTVEAGQIVDHIKELMFKEKVGSIDVSISFGHETKTKKDESLDEVLKKAENYMYKKKLFESQGIRGKTISTIISTLNEKNRREEEHSLRVSKLCEDMGYALNLSKDDINELKTVGLLHDIGKIAIEDNILNKTGKLTPEEYEEIKRHPEIGYRILSTVNEMAEMAEYVLAHHERFDGMGYPKKLKAEQIPLQSRIITIADSYDAMVSERSYRGALSEETAIHELEANAGTQFDAKLVKVFIEKVLKSK